MSQDGEPELAKIQSTMADAIPFTQLISKCAE
jgi:polo-like kinase 1